MAYVTATGREQIMSDAKGCRHDRREGFDECLGCYLAKKVARQLLAEADARILNAATILNDDVDTEAGDRLARISSDLSGVKP
jgi:hypothetical protein